MPRNKFLKHLVLNLFSHPITNNKNRISMLKFYLSVLKSGVNLFIVIMLINYHDLKGFSFREIIIRFKIISW